MSNNLWAPNTMKHGPSGPSSSCPQDMNEINFVCADPMLMGETTANTYLDNFDITPQPGSPAIGAGVNNGVSLDLIGTPRPNPPSIGALE